jgi:hypothetical protein
VVGHDDRQGADPGQVPRQLGMPGGGEDLIHALVAFAGKGALMGLQHFFETVANAPVSAIEVTSHDEQHRQRQVMVGCIRQPQPTRLGVQPTLEGEEVSVDFQFRVKNGFSPSAKLGYRSAIRLLLRIHSWGRGMAAMESITLTANGQGLPASMASRQALMGSET